MNTDTLPDSATHSVTDEQIAAYRRDGFVKVPGIITPEQAAYFHAEALRIAKANADSKQNAGNYRAALNQTVNVWPENAIMRRLSFHVNVTAAAKTLAGVPLRMWHDHVLCKDPHNGARTEWHQDQPYWPHTHSANPISCWIALCDVPAERGCMSFMPGQQHRDDLPVQVLTDPRSLFDKDPELEYAPKVTLPLKAGDCTFHHGRTPHMANANDTDQHRVAHVVIFTDTGTRVAADAEGNVRRHAVTKDLELTPGQLLPDDLFPEI